MPIVLISEALLLRSTLSDGGILCDRVLCGFLCPDECQKAQLQGSHQSGGPAIQNGFGLLALDERR
jgi:hypothetical protein